jgi:uncharacterized protein YlxP (DUF503 family)
MKRKRHSPDHPVCLFGKIVFDFFNNEDEEFKARTMRSLAKDLRKEINVSCLPVDEGEIQNPERGTLALALVAANREQGKAILDKALAILDGKAPARILMEEFEVTELT